MQLHLLLHPAADGCACCSCCRSLDSPPACHHDVEGLLPADKQEAGEHIVTPDASTVTTLNLQRSSRTTPRATPVAAGGCAQCHRCLCLNQFWRSAAVGHAATPQHMLIAGRSTQATRRPALPHSSRSHQWLCYVAVARCSNNCTRLLCGCCCRLMLVPVFMRVLILLASCGVCHQPLLTAMVLGIRRNERLRMICTSCKAATSHTGAEHHAQRFVHT